MRLLHAGDLHLGSSLCSLAPGEAALWREQQFTALEALLTDGISAGAQAVLLAGDCFDTPVPDDTSVARFFGILGALSVPVVIAPGNHDYFSPRGFWAKAPRPDNVFVFQEEELSFFDFPQLNLAVYGFAYQSKTAKGPNIGTGEALIPHRTHVLLAHSDVTSPLSPYAPISKGQLEKCGFAYVALGHIHVAPAPFEQGRTTAAYCGFFAGRGFDETGAGGALLVDITPGIVKLTPLVSGANRFEEKELDVTGALNGEDVRLAVKDCLTKAALPASTALRLSLVGNVSPDCHPNGAALLECGKGLSLFRVVDRTLPLYDAEYLSKAPTLQGAFYRALLPALSSENEEERTRAAEALRLGFAAFAGKEALF